MGPDVPSSPTRSQEAKRRLQPGGNGPQEVTDPGRPQGANGSLETLPEPGIPESGTFLTESLGLEIARPLGWSLSTKGSGPACLAPIHTRNTHLQRLSAHFHLGSSLLRAPRPSSAPALPPWPLLLHKQGPVL